MSKWTKASRVVKDKESHPLHRIHLAAMQIVNGHRKAYVSSGLAIPADMTIPIWMEAEDGHTYRVTLDFGPAIQAEYAVFKAQTK